MRCKVGVKQRGLPDGRVSLEALGAVTTVLRMAIRSETMAIGVRKPGRGRIGRLARESANVSLVAISTGSGVLEWEPENETLFDAPSGAFESIVNELTRSADDGGAANFSIQKSLLTLENLVNDSPIEYLDFVDGSGRTGRADAQAIYRIRLSIESLASETSGEPVVHTGRLMELDIAERAFRIDDIHNNETTIHYESLFEQIIKDGINRYVTVSVTPRDTVLHLLSLHIADEIPESSFYDQKQQLSYLINDQGVAPIRSIDDYALTDPDPVSEDEFSAFLRSARVDR